MSQSNIAVYNRGYNFTTITNPTTAKISVNLGLTTYNYPILAIHIYIYYTSNPASGYVKAAITPLDELVTGYVGYSPTIEYFIDAYKGAMYIPLAPYEYVNITISISAGANLEYDAFLYDWMGEN